MDFVIESESLCIAIEMKIYSGDQSKQLERYEKYCKNRKKINGVRKEYFIYYLTLLQDEKPSEQSIGKMNIEKLRNISVEKEILVWLKSGLKFIENEKYRSNFIISYISTIENLVCKEEKMKNSIKTV
ncbi:PD-(D/E)XK nuclease family protein, partial [Fusobacterium polymorphum]